MWTGKTGCGQVEISLDGWWTGKQMKEYKRSSTIIHGVSYALKTDVHGCHICVCNLFQVIKYISAGLHV